MGADTIVRFYANSEFDGLFATRNIASVIGWQGHPDDWVGQMPNREIEFNDHVRYFHEGVTTREAAIDQWPAVGAVLLELMGNPHVDEIYYHSDSSSTGPGLEMTRERWNELNEWYLKLRTV